MEEPKVKPKVNKNKVDGTPSALTVGALILAPFVVVFVFAVMFVASIVAVFSSDLGRNIMRRGIITLRRNRGGISGAARSSMRLVVDQWRNLLGLIQVFGFCVGLYVGGVILLAFFGGLFSAVHPGPDPGLRIFTAWMLMVLSLGFGVVTMTMQAIMKRMPLSPLTTGDDRKEAMARRERSAILFARPVGIIYLIGLYIANCMITFPEFFSGNPSMGLVVIVLASGGLLMSSFATVRGLRRNYMLGLMVSAGVVMTVLTVFNQFDATKPVVESVAKTVRSTSSIVASAANGIDRTARSLEAGDWQEYQVVVVNDDPAMIYLSQDNGESFGSVAVNKTDLVYVDDNDFVTPEDSPKLYRVTIFKTGDTTTKESGYCLIASAPIEPKGAVKGKTEEPRQDPINAPNTPAGQTPQESQDVVLASSVDLDDGAPFFEGTLTTDWTPTGIILHLRPEKYPYADAAFIEGHGKPLNAEDVSRIEVCFAPIAGPQYAADSSLTGLTPNGRRDMSYGLVFATDANKNNNVMYARLTSGEPLPVRAEVRQAYYNTIR